MFSLLAKASSDGVTRVQKWGEGGMRPRTPSAAAADAADAAAALRKPQRAGHEPSLETPLSAHTLATGSSLHGIEEQGARAHVPVGPELECQETCPLERQHLRSPGSWRGLGFRV